MYIKSLAFLGFPRHEITSTGRVFGPKRELIPCADKNGYLYVCLYFMGKQNNKRLHQLVAQAFIPNPENYPCVGHIDENKENNQVENLQWCTPEMNGAYNAEHKSRAAESYGNSKLTWDDVKAIRALHADKSLKFNGSQVARDFGIKPQTVSKIMHSVIWQE